MSNAETLLNTAFTAYNAGDFEQAESLARAVLAAIPNQGDALYLLGLIAFQAGALEPAEGLLYQAVRAYPQTASYQLALASVLERRGRLDEALSFYSKYPQDDRAVVQIGFIQARKKNLSSARQAFRKALSLNPHNPNAHIGLAEIKRVKGQMKAALEELKKIDLKDRTGEVWYQFAIQYRLMRQYKKALAAANEAVRLQALPAFLDEQGLILKYMGKYEEALSSFRQASEADPYFAQAWSHQGDTALKQKDFQNAEVFYKRALQLDEKLLETQVNLGQLLYRSGRVGEALEHYRAALVTHPQYVPALYNLAILLEERGEYEEALGLYFNILTLKEKDTVPVLVFRIADALTHLAKKGASGRKQAQLFAKGWAKSFPKDPVAGHMASALNGTPSMYAQAFSKALYEAFAETYDARMRLLQARWTQGIKRMTGGRRYQNVLDLGCGTGRCGAALAAQCACITGVDNSAAMLKRAQKTKRYSRFIRKDVLVFLAQNRRLFDLVVAGELVCYLPELEPFFKGVFRALQPGGDFIFSVEAGDDRLTQTGRYAYRADTIQTMLQQTGFVSVRIKEENLRKEGSLDTAGYIVKAQKPL